MTPTQLNRRQSLLSRNDAALDRWPRRVGQEFVREMTEVVQGLEALAHEVDSQQGEPLERSRNWRFVGNAYFDLANGKDLRLLGLSADAYKKAETLLVGIDNAIEKMKLDYSYGHALFQLSAAKDLALAREARRRYACALEIAHSEMPAAVESARAALADADRVIALLTQAESLSERIGELEEQAAEEATSPDSVTDDAALFQKLLDVYNKDVAAGKISETRQQALNPILSQLESLMQSSPDDLAGLTTQISRMLDLAGSMSHLTGTSQQGSSLPAGSRADAVWKRFSELKLDLSRDLMLQRGGSEAQFSGIEILKRCGYAYTFLHKPGCDDETVSGYETDVLRQLACEVRAFLLRDHLTLISPVWPSLPSPQNPNAVFFSGSAAVRELLAEFCGKQKLKLFAQAGPKDFASTRWDQLHACHVALFDFTGYVRPDPDRPIDVSTNGRSAAVSYELGIALTLGRTIIVLANEGQDLPFDVDIEPVRLKGDGRDGGRLTDAIDDAIYGLQRGGKESSIAATWAYLTERFSDAKNPSIKQLLRLVDDEVLRDPVKFRRFVEPVLGRAGDDAPQMVFPAWPGSYSRPGERRCFHVTAFGPSWAEDTMKIVAAACKTAKPRVEYVRGDQVLEPDIIRSIWNNLCQATHVVVDLTGLNANVALELGIAHSLGRNVLLLTQDESKKGYFPSIAKVRTHSYSATGHAGLEPLRRAVDQFLSL